MFILLLSSTLILAKGQTYTEIDTLMGHLFNESRYNKFLRPIRNQSQVIKVNFTQYFNSIDYFDISSGEILIKGFFEITWIDELLQWNPSLYGGKESISLPNGKFWKPDLKIANGPANDDTSINNRGFSSTWLSYQGVVLMIPWGSFRTKCNVDFTFYPYDIHECSFQFVVSNHDTSELLLYSTIGDIHTENMAENGEWEIQNGETKVKHLKEENTGKISMSMLQTTFSLKRRPASEIINIYVPISLVSFLNLITCFVRPDSGERLTFAVTLYLSLVVSTTAVTEKIPKNSLKMPYLSYEILYINFINTLGVTWSIFIVHLASKSYLKQHLPMLIVKMVLMKRQGIQKTSESNYTSGTINKTHENGETSYENKTETSEQLHLDNTSESNISGLEVAEVLDKTYFWVITFVLSVLNLFFGGLLLKLWTI